MDLFSEILKMYVIKIELPNREHQFITTSASSEKIAVSIVCNFYNCPDRAIKEITEFLIPKN